jgi:transcriptional regulator with XRE-family HTH domain
MATDPSHGMVGKSVGAKLRAARKAKKYTQGQLAAPDFSVSYVSAIERGQIQPSLRALEILAHRLELSSTDLLSRSSQQAHELAVSTSATNNEEFLIDFILFEAQVSILQNKATEALTQLYILEGKHLTERKRLHQRYLLGWAYLHTSQFQLCENALIEAQQLAQAQKHHYSSLRIYDLLGRTYAAMHHHQRALQSYQNCLQLLEQAQVPDLFFKCHVYNHLGQLHMQLNDFPCAVAMFQQAILIAAELVTPQQIQTSYRNICKYYIDTAEYALAALYSYKYWHMSHQRIGRTPISEIYLYLGRAMIKYDPQATRDYFEGAFQQKNNQQDTLSLASITIRLAEWYFLHKDLPAAEKKAEEAYKLAQPSGDTIVTAETLLIWGRIQCTMTHYEAGDKHLIAGLNMLERLQIYDELAEQLAMYAQLLAERNMAQQAITYYKRAFESRQKTGTYL